MRYINLHLTLTFDLCLAADGCKYCSENTHQGCNHATYYSVAELSCGRLAAWCNPVCVTASRVCPTVVALQTGSRII